MAAIADDMALAVVDARPVAMARQEYTEQQKQLIKTACMATQATDDEFRLFLEVARQSGLNPLARQIYAIHRKSGKDRDGRDRYQMTIQTGIDGYRLIAARTGQLAGIDDPKYDTEDGDNPNRATVTVWRMIGGQRCPFTASARWREYVQTKEVWENNKPTGRHIPSGQWGKMPWLMLGKCAEALALRKAFPAELSGLYTGEEMDQADSAPVSAPTGRVTVQAAPQAEPARQAPPAKAAPKAKPSWQGLQARAHAIGLYQTVEEWQKLVIEHNGGNTDAKTFGAEEYRAVEAFIEAQERKRAAAEAAIERAQAPREPAGEPLMADGPTDLNLEDLDTGAPGN